ncbi:MULTISPECIES: peptidoglycan DD-metalloendopeptidase family protein [unclassified Anaerobiospirillum]|uniref:peptidoglycan DD-metalloendopeptidase family protein n=1 Tax=unclassified Anaerobiospirillum TaxID=2647410 RepID=UPI001FF19AF8|nr:MULTISPECIES: peptidoglycan DD-metalloendopeptidase family protein [unclassified Anaerobiospirillum]MCK0527278.1 peptidoglycan DD-metalloendopeptidase family protein [Anaerobiospirillum sp. NML120449]MCK0535431.1 peptidoglycan DD-metalloendopeptidase family protein [Anaerobiospirillum sp. NML120511]MCK0540852.1 peptidoglycan DD-metalloendopeptidase family protein [Anaerobiospirillum sp. NML02-A-032]
MQTEDYIFQDDLSASKYPLSKKHVIAISSTVFLASALYFALPQDRTVTTVASHNPPVYGDIGDENGYEDVIDPTRSLTDILLTNDNDLPASSSDVLISENNNNQDVYTQSELGSMENYDEDDLTAALSYTDESALEASLNELASKDASMAAQKINWIAEDVQRGDTLSSIFSDMNIPYAVMMAIADNPEAGSNVTNLRPGHKVYFSFDKDNNLTGFVKQINGDEQWRFTRSDVTTMNFDVVREPKGEHIMVLDENGKLVPSSTLGDGPAYRNRGRLVVATIEQGDSFSNAAHEAGLTYSEIRQITDLFKGQVQFTRHIQPGDSIRVLFSEDKGAGKINAIELKLKKVGTLSAYRNLADDKYYDERGYNAASSTFRRFPIDGKVIISSHFNPSRRHPVTGVIRPHNGTDFAVRVGTPIVSPADGVVELAKYSRTAGYYIIIRHRGSYSTVYMHCSKLLVKQGDSVKIGQMIARSGNTGISTGPHLHYELRRNGRPVNAMRITLPANDDTTVARKYRQRFNSNVAMFKKELYQDSLIAQKD